MKLCWIFVYLITSTTLLGQQDPAILVLPDARIVHTLLDADRVTILHLKPGYVSSVRLPDDVSSVVLGNTGSFKAEHSEAEPRLVFLKPIASSPSETNALITTRNGREISLHLISTGTSGPEGPVDFVVEYSAPRSFLIDPARPSFVVADTRSVGTISLPTAAVVIDDHQRTAEMLRQEAERHPQWRGKQLRVSLGRVRNEKQDMIVVFSVMNASAKTIELLPPQVQLAGVTKSKHRKAITADQLPVKDFEMTARRLAPQARTEVAVAFERPSFKQASEQMLLQVAQAEEVDRPVLLPIPFVSPGGETR